jgi:hypothetical protein
MVINAQAKGWLKGCPSTGVACQAHVDTVPVSDSDTHSVNWAPVTGSNSAGGKYTRPSEPRVPSSRHSDNEVKNRESNVPTVLLYGYETSNGATKTSPTMA